jgi:hypothetical protein
VIVYAVTRRPENISCPRISINVFVPVSRKGEFTSLSVVAY